MNNEPNTTTLRVHVAPELSRLKKHLRKQGLNDLTLLDYDKYLQSALWRKIRAWVLDRDSSQCLVCKAKPRNKLHPVEVHHRSYDVEVLEGKQPDALVTLCRRCHKLVEFYPDGSKRNSVVEKDEEYGRLTHIHTSIETGGLRVSLEERNRSGASRIELRYVGNAEYTVFYSIDELVLQFLASAGFQKDSRLRLPMPFSRQKLRQKSGAALIDEVSGKVVVRAIVTNNVATIRTAKTCRYPVFEQLISIVGESRYWRI